MKCICGYQSFPNNARVFANHVQDCMVDGPCKELYPVPTIVWRDGGFAVARELAEGEQTYEIGLVRYNAPELEEEEEDVVVEPTEEPSQEDPS
jgi:hypothetical protein